MTLEQLSEQLLKKDINVSVDDESAVGDAFADYKKGDVDLARPIRQGWIQTFAREGANIK